MECQLRSMSEANSACGESSVPQGKVEAVCREWLVREDGVLAYKLQSEEIEHHYGHNKEMSQIVRSDLLEARMIQRSEEEEAKMMQRAYEEMLLEQENTDAMIAKQIQDKLLQEEMEKQRQIEEEDKLIALELQKKEKLRLQRKREERELRQVEKVKAVQSTSSEPQPKPPISFIPPTMQETATSPLERDFNDLCIQPPSCLSYMEQKRFREEQDAELARFLQDQELKRRSEDAGDQKLAIEAQDRELAKALQEQERARVRRAKERAKQKALLQQQQQQENASSVHDPEAAAYDSYKISPIEDNHASQTVVKMKDNECYGYIDHYKSPIPGFQPVHNIAMVLDPTYTQRKQSLDSPTLSHGSMTHSPLITPQNLLIEPLPPVCSSRGIDDNFFLNDDDTAAPPYMPIQGQRRPQTLEKAKKSKRPKEGCKQQ